MPRSIWSGAISFGLVNVPVKLYSSVSRKTVRFHQLNGKTGHRIAQRRVDPDTGDEVAYEDIVKGFELSKDRYVVITPDELESLDPEKTRSIDIEDFVDLQDIDPVYYDHPYYLVPDKGASKAYGLLLHAMEEADKVAIARVVIRSKEQLVAIRPAFGRALMMETMVFADEVVSPEEIDDLPEADDLKISDRELKMAQQLIDSLSSEFEPAKYKDEYREKVLELIERKAAGEEIAVQPEAPQPKKVPDLMAALEASLAAVKGDGDGKAEKKQSSSKPSGKKAAALGRVAVQLEPDARLAAAVDAPAVRELAHEIEAPAGRARRVGLRLGHLEAAARVADLDPQRPLAGDDHEQDHVVVAQVGMADRVGDELGDEQPRVLEPARREMVGDLAERPARLGGRIGIPRELDLESHGPGSTSPGSSTKDSRSRIRVRSNTRITSSAPATSANGRPALPARSEAVAIARSPLESMKTRPRRSTTTGRSSTRASSCSSTAAPARSSSPASAITVAVPWTEVSSVSGGTNAEA